jgi:cytochrome P450
VSIAIGVPTADWLNPGDMMSDPYPSYARLRELGPVVYVPAVERFLVTTYDAVREAEQHPEVFSSYSETNLTMVRSLGGRPMLRKDDPDHAAERGAINPTLRPRQVAETWSPRFRENVDHWIDRLIDVGPAAADLNRDFAAPVASQNLIDLLGFPADTDVQDMHRWSTDFIAGIGNLHDDPEIWRRCERSAAEVSLVLDELLPHLRRRADSSVTSHLLQVGLAEDVVRANVHLAIAGGMNEPQHMITNTVWALSEHPAQRKLALEGEVSWGDVFDEVVRWVSPIGLVPRETTEDTEWFGVPIPKHANVGLLLASANRDSAVFAEAEKLDITRVAKGHLGFGGGVHLCAGKWAAKAAIGETAIPRLYERLPALAVDGTRPPTWDGWVFRGMTSLPVTW